MFGIGGTELLVILVVALVVLGPKSVPQIARTLGKVMGEFRRVSTEFQRTLNTEVEVEEHEKRKKEAKKDLFGDESSTKPSETVKASQASAASFAGASTKASPDAATQAPAEVSGTSSGETPDEVPAEVLGEMPVKVPGKMPGEVVPEASIEVLNDISPEARAHTATQVHSADQSGKGTL